MAPELSVLVPCFNEEGNLPELVERTERIFDRRGIAGEIILVDDGSQDGTGAEIDALAATHPRVAAVHHATNRGMAAAWKARLSGPGGFTQFFQTIGSTGLAAFGIVSWSVNGERISGLVGKASV